MYKQHIDFKILFAFLILVAIGCRKDDYTETPTIINPPIIESVETGVSGVVSDESGEALARATVQVRSRETTTDANGYFFIDNIVLDGQGSLVTVSKAGHFTGYKQVFPTKEGGSFARFALVPKGQAQTFSSSSGATVSVGDEASVVFPADAISYADGQAYTGTVKLYSTYFDPTDGNTFVTMPGNLGGQDAQGNRVQLGTYGMIGVELEDSNGRKLQLKEGKAATISLNIPSEIVASAPETIPLWHFDEQLGIWTEDGQAIKQDNSYTGQVSHFSFWNCDRPWPAVKLKMTLVDESGSPINAYHVSVFAEGVGAACGTSNSFGQVCGYVPAGVELTVLAYSCDEEVVNQSIGTLQQDTDIGNVEILFLTNTTTIEGRLLDCLGQGSSRAYGVLKYEGFFDEIIVPDADGNFSKTFTACTNVGSSITFYDKTELTTSETIQIDVNTEINNLGDITVCDDLDEYIRFSVDGNLANEALAVDAVVDLIDGNKLKISPVTTVTGGAGFEIDDISLGSNTPISARFDHPDFTTAVGSIGCGDYFSCDQFSITILTLGSQAGEYITGTFSGTLLTFPVEDLQNPQIAEVFVEGQFKLKIDYAYQGASVSGKVWFDSDGDGVRTAADPLVQTNGGLWITNGLQLDEAVFQFAELSDDGEYQVGNLRPGDYTLSVTGGSGGFDATAIDAGTDDTVDNDFGSVEGKLAIELTLTEGQVMTNVDAGLLPEDNLDMRLRHTGCQSETELIIDIVNGVPPYSIEIDGVPQLTTLDQFIQIPLSGGQSYNVKVIDAFMSVTEGSYTLPLNGVRLSVNVFEDTAPNIDGAFNGANFEQVFEGIPVSIYDQSGSLVESFSSTAALFEDDITELVAGQYYFEADLPAGYTFTSKSTFSYGSNIIDPTTGRSELIDIECNSSYYLFVGLVAE